MKEKDFRGIYLEKSSFGSKEVRIFYRILTGTFAVTILFCNSYFLTLGGAGVALLYCNPTLTNNGAPGFTATR